MSERLQVRTACAKLPHVTATPIATGVPLSSAVDEVVYTVTGASIADIARLQECVAKFPSVQGMDLRTPPTTRNADRPDQLASAVTAVAGVFPTFPVGYIVL